MVKLDHLSLAVSDWRAARDWYVGCLGFKVEFEVPAGGPSGGGVVALQDDAGLTVFLEQVAEQVLSGQGAYTLQLDDVDTACARLAAAGVPFLAEPQKLFWGYGAELADPDGHVWRLYDETTMREKGG